MGQDMTYAGQTSGFLCFYENGGYYAVRDGVTAERPNGGLRYAHVEADTESGLEAAIADYLYFEAMPTEDLMEQVAEEMKWSGRPGLASAELSRRDAQKAVA